MNLDRSLLDAWRRHLKRRGLAEQTIKDWARRVSRLEKWLKVPILDATHHDIDDWLDERGITNPGTRRVELSAVSSFYRWAIRDEHTTRNPVDRIDRPALPRRLPRPFPTDDLDYALGQADPMMRAMLLSGALSGLRCKEIAGLKREDFLDHWTPPLLLVTEGKGDKERAVPLHPALWTALCLHGLPRGGHVFVGRRLGRPLTPNGCSKMINMFLRSVGVAAKAHQLRHFFATEALGACSDLRVVQELMGHSSPNSTAIYTAYNARKAAAAVLGITIGRTAA